jgi:hypothetical protein
MTQFNLILSKTYYLFFDSLQVSSHTAVVIVRILFYFFMFKYFNWWESKINLALNTKKKNSKN